MLSHYMHFIYNFPGISKLLRGAKGNLRDAWMAIFIFCEMWMAKFISCETWQTHFAWCVIGGCYYVWIVINGLTISCESWIKIWKIVAAKMHHLACWKSKFSRGSMPPDPPRTLRQQPILHIQVPSFPEKRFSRIVAYCKCWFLFYVKRE